MTLIEMVAKMRQHGANGDLEVAHSEADGLLVAALELLAGTVTFGHAAAKEIRDLLEEYENVGKWYA